MQFGVWTPSRVDLPPVARLAEEQGFDTIHLYDSQMVYGELFSCMALCAAATTRIRVGPGVTNPLTRIAPVMADGLATINRLAPGRTFLAIGTGYTSMKTMGQKGATLRELRDYVEQVQRLVRGEETSVTFRGREGIARFVHLPGSVDDGFYNTIDPIPSYIAAAGPKGLALAGEIADGVILSIKHPDDLDVAAVRAAIAVGAERAGRSVDEIGIRVMLDMYVLDPGEDPLSREVKESVVGVWQSQLGSWAARRPPVPSGFERLAESDIPEDARAAANAYRDALAPSDGGTHPFESERWLLEAYNGHAWRTHPSVLDRIPAEFIAKRAFVAQADEIVAQIREWERQGVTSVGPQLQHDLDRSSEQLRRIGSRIIPAFCGQG